MGFSVTRNERNALSPLLMALCFAFGTLAATIPTARAAESEIVMPCPLFKAGNSWLYKVTLPIGTLMVSKTVLASDGKSIRLGVKTELALPDSERRILSAQDEEDYSIEAGTVVLNASTTSGSRIAYEPPKPTCGKMHSDWSGSVKVDIAGQAHVRTDRVTLRLIGMERVTVPAGTFDTMAVEMVQESGGGNSGLRSRGRIVQIIYSADGVGVVRVLHNINQMQPQSSASRNPESDRLIREGIQRLQEGKDIADVQQKLAALNAASKSAQRQDEANSELTVFMELQSAVMDH